MHHHPFPNGLLIVVVTLGNRLWTAVLRLFVYRPPNIPSPKTVRRYLTKALFAHEEVLISMRIRLFLNMLVFLSLCPLFAFAWFLDDVLFPGYRDISIIKPLFLITGSRSGSTQLSQS